MHSYEIVLWLLTACVGLGLLGRRLGLPDPILLVIGGLLLSFQPWIPHVPPLDPNLVLLFFLPPLLYAAAFNTPWKSFRANLRAISLMAVGLVIFTTSVIAVVAHFWLGLPWAVGFVLGAIVSPPDAVAALAITRRLEVPEIVTTILEGESLVNDAAALVCYRTAVAAVVGGTFSLLEASINFVLVGLGGLGIGLVGAWLVVHLHRWLNRHDLADAKLTIAITLLTPFAIYLPAEHLHVSGVLAVVTAGLWVGTRCEALFSEEIYHEARAVWEMIEFLLNGLIFILIGFQLPAILDSLGDRHSIPDLFLYAMGLSLVAIVARIVWVFPGAYWPLDRSAHLRQTGAAAALGKCLRRRVDRLARRGLAGCGHGVARDVPQPRVAPVPDVLDHLRHARRSGADIADRHSKTACRPISRASGCRATGNSTKPGTGSISQSPIIPNGSDSLP